MTTTGRELARLRAELDAAFESSMGPVRARSGPLGVLFSGGVDSSLLAWELRSRPNVVLWTIGRDGSHDLRAGREGAERIGLTWEPVRIDAETILRTELRYSTELAGASAVSREVLLSLALAFDGVRERELVCGQGPDELFLGYAHFRDLGRAEASARSERDLRRLWEEDWPRTLRMAERAGKSVFAPYLTAEFEEAARHVPLELRLPGTSPKLFFREWALARGLPAELALRPKKAIQYGSGVSALLRRKQAP